MVSFMIVGQCHLLERSFVFKKGELISGEVFPLYWFYSLLLLGIEKEENECKNDFWVEV